MSGKCYSIDGMVDQPELKSDRQMYPENEKSTNESGLTKLLEYEKLANLAEEKCVILRSELERVKQMYNNRHEIINQNSNMNNNNKPQKVYNNKRIIRPSFKHDKSMSDNIEIHPLEQFQQAETMGKPFYNTPMIRQNSSAITTETSSGPINTINNIIDGITESIHFEDLPTQMNNNFNNQVHGIQQIKLNSKPNAATNQTKKQTSSKNIINKLENVLNNTNPQNASRNAVEMQELLNMRPKRLLSRNSIKTLNGKKKTRKLISKIERKLKQNDSKPNIIPKTTISLVNKRSRKLTANKQRQQRQWMRNSTNHLIRKPSDLVEIYHNVAVKNSNSSDVNNNAGRLNTRPKLRPMRDLAQIVPPLNINLNDGDYNHKNHTYNLTRRALTTISRNYELPTIASRLKKVAKFYYMQQSTIRVIPFCPASSISPSHNIGINIQQVMSMVKTKQPFKEISPTLVHNIGLAADRWKNKPLPFLISSVTSRTGSLCPLMKAIPNYKQMQEMAKLIPEEITEENPDDTESPNDKTNESFIITGPSGDMKITKRAESVWTANSKNMSERCTCLPEKGVNLQQMINKYKTNYAGSTIGSQIVKISPKSRVIRCKSKVSHTTYIPENIKPENKIKTKDKNHTNKETLINNEASKLDIEGKQTEDKEKKLKTVLIKLHDEFDSMQKRYEELKRKRSTDLSQEQLKEMERLDNELNSKEDEIVMVMGLYEEVLALKKQVKNLKQNVGHDLTVTKDQTSNQHSTAIMHLHKLLKQVQYYQNRYKQI